MDFFMWERMNKNERLASLKSNVEFLERRISLQTYQFERLLSHFGLIEVAGPQFLTHEQHIKLLTEGRL